MLPDVPWSAPDGPSYKALGARADRLLSRLEAAINSRGLRDQVPVTQLAAQMAEMNTALRELGRSKLAVDALVEYGGELERGRRPGRHLHLA